VREQGRRSRSGAVTVRHVALDDDDRCLVAYAVGRHAGTAVARNRIRRRLRALVAEAAAEGRIPRGAMVISAASSVATAPFALVRRDLGRAFEGIGAARPRPS
jgi:ribonuclease P protein component